MNLTNNSNKDWKQAGGGMLLGRTTLTSDMWSNDSDTAEEIGAELELLYNASTEDPDDIAGRPFVRGKEAGGGPMYAFKNTQVLGGLDFAESTNGNSHDFAGVAAFNLDNLHRTGDNDYITLFVPSFTQAPSVGDTITSSGGGTGIVVAVDGLTAALSLTKFTAFNYVTIRRTNAIAFAAAETITSDDAAGVAMAPTPATLTLVSVGDTQVGNADAQTAAEILVNTGLVADNSSETVWIMVEGITMGWVDDEGGAIADGYPLTWPDFAWALSLAAINTSTPDNIIATALMAESVTGVNQLIKMHIFATAPISYFVAGSTSGLTTPGEQGVPAQ